MCKRGLTPFDSLSLTYAFGYPTACKNRKSGNPQSRAILHRPCTRFGVTRLSEAVKQIATWGFAFADADCRGKKVWQVQIPCIARRKMHEIRGYQTFLPEAESESKGSDPFYALESPRLSGGFRNGKVRFQAAGIIPILPRRNTECCRSRGTDRRALRSRRARRR